MGGSFCWLGMNRFHFRHPPDELPVTPPKRILASLETRSIRRPVSGDLVMRPQLSWLSGELVVASQVQLDLPSRWTIRAGLVHRPWSAAQDRVSNGRTPIN